MNILTIFNNFKSPLTSVLGLIAALQAVFGDIGLPLSIPGWVGNVLSGAIGVYLIFFRKDKKAEAKDAQAV